MKTLFIFIFTTATLLVNAQAGTQKQIGFEAAWVNTTGAVVLNNTLYTTEKNGSLVETNLNTGMRKVIAKAGFENNKYLFTSGNDLYMLDFNGTISKISLSPIGKEKVGIAASFKGINAFVVLDGMFYGVEASGALIMLDLATGDVQSTKNSNYMNVSLLFTVNSKVYCLEKSGSLFEWPINGGIQHMIGAQAAFGGTYVGTAYDKGLYLVNKAGILMYVDTNSGSINKIGSKAAFNLTKYLFGANGKLYSIETMGSLYEITTK